MTIHEVCALIHDYIAEHGFPPEIASLSCTVKELDAMVDFGILKRVGSSRVALTSVGETAAQAKKKGVQLA